MRISLIDLDRKKPNLALSKLSRYHKMKGDVVGMDLTDPDKVYISCIFSKNRSTAEGLKKSIEDEGIVVEVGGSGYDITSKLPEHIDLLKPDYSLYSGWDYSVGFSSRGCVRNCPFCIVPEKEGKFRKVQHPKEFHERSFKSVLLYDNNILVDKDWFYEVTDWALEEGVKMDFNQGLDIRFIDSDIAKRLKLLRTEHISRMFRFAWDNIGMEDQVMEGIRLLKDAGIDLKQYVGFYVLTNFDTTEKEDYYRAYKLRMCGTNTFIMIYGKGTSYVRKLARWANRRDIYWSDEWHFSKYRSLEPRVRHLVADWEYRWSETPNPQELLI